METNQTTSEESIPVRQVKTQFQTLQYLVAEVFWRWKVWKQLFLADPKKSETVTQKIDLMNDTAPQFFAMLQSLLFEDVVLRICRLTDPKESGPRKRPNLSVRAVCASADWIPATVHDEADRLLADLEKKLKRPFKEWRDHRIAHQDHATAVGIESLPRISVAHVEQMLVSIVTVMKLLDPQGGSHEFSYEDMIALGDGESLIFALECSQRYHEECMARGQRPLA